MNTSELARLAPYAEIFNEVIDKLETISYGEVRVSLKIHAGRIVNINHASSKQSLPKEGKGGKP
jgi:hypothetical protein